MWCTLRSAVVFSLPSRSMLMVVRVQLGCMKTRSWFRDFFFEAPFTSQKQQFPPLIGLTSASTRETINVFGYCRFYYIAFRVSPAITLRWSSRNALTDALVGALLLFCSFRLLFVAVSWGKKRNYNSHYARSRFFSWATAISCKSNWNRTLVVFRVAMGPLDINNVFPPADYLLADALDASFSLFGFNLLAQFPPSAASLTLPPASKKTKKNIIEQKCSRSAEEEKSAEKQHTEAMRIIAKNHNYYPSLHYEKKALGVAFYHFVKIIMLSMHGVEAAKIISEAQKAKM